MDQEIRVRFAPSPTGDLHVGGVRTALFNWLFARHNKGKFLLRVEDTDKKRSTPEAIQVILDGMKWMGLESDEEIVYQSKRLQAHQAAAKQILADGNAYRCFCTPEEAAQQREEARANKTSYMYDQRCLHLNEEEIHANLEAGKPYAVRIKIPGEVIAFDDLVHGKISVHGKEIEDFVILRSDGTPTYMMAVVVDDADMGVTHIIRGDDHVSNTPKQVLIYRYLNRPVPKFAHVPIILGPDKRKLSKRHGATSITGYREMGIRPETMINYLGLLGWSPGDDRSEISRDELIELFDTKGISSKSAVFDEAKLKWLNGFYISRESFEDVLPELKKFATEAVEKGVLHDLPDEAMIETAWNLLKNRIHVLPDLYEWGVYIFQDPQEFDPKGVRKNFKKEENVCEQLSKLADELEKLNLFNHDELEKLVRDLAEKWELKASKVIHPLRLAVSGVTGGPSLFDLLVALGKETIVRRIRKTVSMIESDSIPLKQ